jgi:antirestriction protein
MLSKVNDAPRVYVGTYAKYNDGNLFGAWLDLDNYSDRESFYEACKELHKDETDPELMFQDFENFPRSLYSESDVSDELIEFANLDDDDRELLTVYQNGIDESATIEQARENFQGKYDSEEDWAAQFLEDTGSLAEIPENLRNYFDFQAYARDARLGGDVTFVRHKGDVWVFWNH